MDGRRKVFQIEESVLGTMSTGQFELGDTDDLTVMFSRTKGLRLDSTRLANLFHMSNLRLLSGQEAL